MKNIHYTRFKMIEEVNTSQLSIQSHVIFFFSVSIFVFFFFTFTQYVYTSNGSTRSTKTTLDIYIHVMSIPKAFHTFLESVWMTEKKRRRNCSFWFASTRCSCIFLEILCLSLLLLLPFLRFDREIVLSCYRLQFLCKIHWTVRESAKLAG